MKKSELAIIVALFAGSGLDAHSTVLSLASGNFEANPLYGMLLNQGEGVFVIFRALFIPLILSIVYRRLLRFAKRMLVNIFVLIPIVVWLLASLNNYLRS